MNTVIFYNGGFYEFDEIEEYYNEYGTDYQNTIGFLNKKDMLQLNQVDNNKPYIITIIDDKSGEHKAYYVNGLEFKMNYKKYEKIAHGEINIWCATTLKDSYN